MNGFALAVRSAIKDPRRLADGIDKGSCGISLADAPQPHVVIDLDGEGLPWVRLRRRAISCSLLTPIW